MISISVLYNVIKLHRRYWKLFYLSIEEKYYSIGVCIGMDDIGNFRWYKRIFDYNGLFWKLSLKMKLRWISIFFECNFDRAWDVQGDRSTLEIKMIMWGQQELGSWIELYLCQCYVYFTSFILIFFLFFKFWIYFPYTSHF